MFYHLLGLVTGWTLGQMVLRQLENHVNKDENKFNSQTTYKKGAQGNFWNRRYAYSIFF